MVHKSDADEDTNEYPIAYEIVGTPKRETGALVSVKNSINEDITDDEKVEEECSIKLLFILSLPRYAAALAWATQWTILGPYLENFLSSSGTQAVQMIGPICGILCGPPVGNLSDHCTSRFGRRRPFLVVGSILAIIGWLLMGYTVQIGEFLGDAKDTKNSERYYGTALLIFLYVWMDVTLTVVSQPAFLIVSDFAGKRMNLGFAFGQAAYLLGCITIAIFVELVDNARLHLPEILGCLSLFVAAGVGIVCFYVKETPYVPAPGTPKRNVFKIAFDALASVYYGIVTMPKMLALYCAIFFITFYGFNTYAGAKGQYFGIVVKNGVATDASTCGNHCTPEQQRFNEGVKIAGGVTDIINYLVGYCVTLAVPYLTARIGAKRMIAGAFIPQMCLIILAFSRSIELNVFLVVCIGTATNVNFALMVPVIIKLLGDDQKANLGTYIGSVNSFYSAGQLVCFALGSLLVEATTLGYAFPILIGGIVTVIGFFMTVVFFKIDLYTV